MKRPNIVKTFGSDAMHGDYLPVKFGTNIVVPKKAYEQIANDNFQYGLESLEKDLQMKDLNSVFFYHSVLVNYLFKRGIAEYSPFEDYPSGAVVSHENGIWIATKEVKATAFEPKVDPCNPCKQCELPLCNTPEYPSKDTGWCKVVTHCTYDLDKESFEKALQALNDSIMDLKGVTGFNIVTSATTGEPELTLTLSDGSTQTIPMNRFGKTILNDDKTITIKNPDGSVVELPRFMKANELDPKRGFFYNPSTNQWEVDLSDLIKSGSGLETDKLGNLKVKPEDFISNDLKVDSQGKLTISPDILKAGVDDAKEYTDNEIKPIEDFLSKLSDKNKDNFNDALNKVSQAKDELNKKLAELVKAQQSGKYKDIIRLEAEVEKLKHALKGKANLLNDYIQNLKNLGLSDDEIRTLLNNALSGTSIKSITPNADNTVTITYADSSKEILAINSVNVDNSTIVGNGADKALEVQLSKRSGNLLSKLDDGLFLGETAKYPNLYIDSVAGNDENIGSITHPLRTLKEAITRNNTGARVNFFFKEDRDYVFDTPVTFKQGTYTLLPYGDFYESLDELYPNDVVDGLQRKVKLVALEKAPRLIFKSFSSWQHGSPSIPKINISSRISMNITGNTNVNIQGFHLISDLSAIKIHAINNKVRDNSASVVDTNDIRVTDGATLSLGVISLKTVGTPSATFDTEENKTFMSKYPQSYQKKDGKGLWYSGLVNNTGSGSASITISRLMHTDYTNEQYLYAPHSWHVGLRSNTVLSLSASGNDEFLAKRVYGVRLDKETKTVLAPVVDVPYKLFVEE